MRVNALIPVLEQQQARLQEAEREDADLLQAQQHFEAVSACSPAPTADAHHDLD